MTDRMVPAVPPTVLVVDDDPEVLRVLAELLADEGYRVRTAADGAAALRELDEAPPDLVLLDCQLPELHGVTLAAGLHAARPGLPLILVSGISDDPCLPGVPFLRKPFDADELLATVAAALAGPRS